MIKPKLKVVKGFSLLLWPSPQSSPQPTCIRSPEPDDPTIFTQESTTNQESTHIPRPEPPWLDFDRAPACDRLIYLIHLPNFDLCLSDSSVARLGLAQLDSNSSRGLFGLSCFIWIPFHYFYHFGANYSFQKQLRSVWQPFDQFKIFFFNQKGFKLTPLYELNGVLC